MFLADLAPAPWARHIALELRDGGSEWTFLVDGRVTPIWSTLGPDESEYVEGASLVAFGPAEVQFRDIALHELESDCRLSIVITSNRFAQRLRVALDAWCRQSAASGSFEVIVVNPSSPDGTSQHLAAVSSSYPTVRLRELHMDPTLSKPAMVNNAGQYCIGDWVWLTDADCIFSNRAVAHVLDAIDATKEQSLLYGNRRHLGRADTDALLAGVVDPVRDFDDLAMRANDKSPQSYPWGYTQIVPRRLLKKNPYAEMNHFAHSDGIFLDDLRRQNVPWSHVESLLCLHLTHPFAWYGTSTYL